jgi:hypothetical protein
MTDKYLGVREISHRSKSSLVSSQKHNFNYEYRATLDNVDETKHEFDIPMTGSVDLEEHFALMDEYNNNQKWKNKKLDTKLTFNRTKWFNKSDKKELSKQEYLFNGGDGNPNQLKTTSDETYIANQSSIEQVLYFSNTINKEDLTEQDWQNVMTNWQTHMKDKHGRVMINSVCHFSSEKTSHIHATFSCLKKENGEVVYKNPQMNKFGYGSALQDEFDSVFNKTINPDELHHKYNRGEKKGSYRDNGLNDHTNSKDVYKTNVNDEIADLIESKDDLSNYEMIEYLKTLKKDYKGDTQAIFYIKKQLRQFKKIHKKEVLAEQNLEHSENVVKYVEDTADNHDNEISSLNNIITGVYESTSIQKTLFAGGYGLDLNNLNITRKKGSNSFHPSASGVVMRRDIDKIKVGERLSF